MPKLNILGLSVQTPEPYAAGHICSAAEAALLNAALTRGLAKGIYRERSEHDADEASVQRYIQEYLRGFREGHERLRAIEVEARRLARTRVEAALYRSGKKLNELSSGEVSALVAREAEKEEILAEARRRIDTLRAIGEASSLEELGVSS